MKRAIILLLAITIPNTSSAATDSEKLGACDAALNAKIQEASLCNLGITYRNDEMARLQKQNADLLSRGSAWYSNPFVWAAVGVIVGAYAGARATR